MTRPTEDDLIRAAGLLEQLAYRHDARNNPTSFPDVVTLLDLLLWVDTELEHAKQAAAYGPGSDQTGAHTIGRHGLNRPVEQRFDWGTDSRPRSRPELSDPLVRELSTLRRGWRTELGQLVDSWRQRSRDTANFPMRTHDTG